MSGSLYPSIECLLVKKGISFFTRNLPKNQQSAIKLCLKLIKFGMRSTLLTFGGKYFEYGVKVIETKRLAIGRYESTFLVDQVAYYLFEKWYNQLKELLWNHIYRDNGLLVFQGKKLLSKIKRWRNDSQSKVNKLLRN